MNSDHTNLDRWDLFIDSNEPKEGMVHSLSRGLRDAVRRGQLAAGYRMPSSRILAEQIGCSRWSVVQAYEQLVAEGYFESRQGAGTFVRALPRTKERSRTARSTPKIWRYDFGAGVPDLSSFPLNEWVDSSKKALGKHSAQILGYGDPAGLWSLREGIAAYLGRVRGAVTVPDDVVITNSSVHAVSILSRVLRKQGIETIGIEHPGWIPLRKPFDDNSVNSIAIPVDDEGLVVEKLHESGARAVLVTPAHQFPMGSVMSANRRTELLHWAEDRDGIIIEDDYDAEFRFDRQPVSALQGMNPDRVALIGSLSKTLAPGVRQGWMVLPQGWGNEVLNAITAIDPNPGIIGQLTFNEMLTTGRYERHLQRLRKEYALRRDALLEALTEFFPQVSVNGIAAGLHLPTILGPGSVDKFIDTAAEKSIRLHPLSRYCLEGMVPEEFQDKVAVVLGFGDISATRIRDGVKLLSEIPLTS